MIQTAFTGDVILATPVIENLRLKLPGAQIDFLLRKGNEGLFRAHPYLAKVWTWEKKYRKYIHLFRLIRQIRSENYDLVINLQRYAASGLITVFSGAKRKAGFKKNPLSPFFTGAYPHRFGKDQKEIHEVERNLSLLGDMANYKRSRPVLYPSREDLRKVATCKEKPYITIAPASVWFTKQYPQDKWLEFLDSEELDSYTVYLTGGQEDQPLCNKLKYRSKHPGIKVLAGELTLLQTAALMKDSVMNYVNDSAPLHLGSAVNAPVTALFLSTGPQFGFGPLSDQSFVVETSEHLECKPCTNHGRKICPRGHFKCAYGINVDKLREKVPN